MNTIKKSHLIWVVLLSLSAFLIGCDSSGDLSSTDGTEDGVQYKQDPEAQTVITNWPYCDNNYFGELNDVETDGILFMREEEKMARDVYLTMYNKYTLPIFRNIPKSESAHMAAVKVLINKYELTDPVGDNIIGDFTNTDIQNLYDDLVEKGSVSEIEALKVGALIEETDILDLDTHIAEIDENNDILTIYTNLKRGSTHHLKAFVWNLKFRGVEYTPQLMNLEDYNKIINP